MFEPNPMRQARINRTIERLRKVEVGQTVAYIDLSAAAQVNIQSDDGRGVLQAARKALEREESRVFLTIRNVGLERASDAAIVHDSPRRLGYIRRAAVRVDRTASCVDYAGLSQDDKMRHTAIRAQARLVGAVASIHGNRRLLAAANGNTEAPKLSMQRALKALQGRVKDKNGET